MPSQKQQSRKAKRHSDKQYATDSSQLLHKATLALLSVVEEESWKVVVAEDKDDNGNSISYEENTGQDIGDDGNNNSNGQQPTRQLSFDSFLELFGPKTTFADSPDTVTEDHGDENDRTVRSLRRGLSGKEQRALLFNAIECFQTGHAVRFFAGLRTFVQTTIDNEDHVPSTAYAVQSPYPEGSDHGNDQNGEDAMVVVGDAKSSRALLFLRLAAACTQVYLTEMNTASQERQQQQQPEQQHSSKQKKQSRPLHVIEEAFEVAFALHRILLSLQDCGPHGLDTQRTIVSLCEAWWNAQAPHRQYLVSQALPLLIQSAALADTAPKSQLLRLYQMRRAVSHIDFTDESSEWCRSILMRVASSPRCLKVPEGRKFTAYLFHADPVLIPSLHQAMRAQIPTNDKNKSKTVVLQAYAEIYYRAWNEAPVPDDDENKDDKEDEHEQGGGEYNIRQEIEHHVLSDLVHSLLHVVQPSMFTALLQVLQQFHDHKTKPHVEDLLERLYAPILWRSMAAANAHVRVNATRVLAHVFPLDQSSHTQTSKHVEKAITVLQGLLDDDDSKVRAAASTTVAQILVQYWDAIPATDIRTLLNQIVTRHASDASSPVVRAAALEAITTLLHTPQSHAVLRPLLPKLGNLIHDKVEKVRLATVRLLQQVKTAVHGVKYFHVVKVPHLTTRLALEPVRTSKTTRNRHNNLAVVPSHSPVAVALSALMLNSYVPQGPGISPMDQIDRTLRFLQKEPRAASVFYATIATHTGVPVVAKLALWLFKCLYEALIGTDDEDVDTTKNNNDDASRSRRTKTRTASNDCASLNCQQKGKRKRNRSHDDSRNEDENRNDENWPSNVNTSSTTSTRNEPNQNRESLLSASNTELVAHVAETICLLWQSIDKSLRKPVNQEWRSYLEDAFSENKLCEIIQSIDRRLDVCCINDGDSNTSHQSLWLDRSRTAMLHCASWVPSNKPGYLIPYITLVFRRVQEQPQDPVHQTSVPGYVSLLFHWGMESDVVASLVASISGFLDRQRYSLFENPSPLADGRSTGKGDRRRGRRNSSMSYDDGSIPRLPPQLALQVVATILQDSRPMFFQARQTLLFHSDLHSQLRDGLAKGFSYLAHWLTDDSQAMHELSDANVEFALLACELYGKLSLRLWEHAERPEDENCNGDDETGMISNSPMRIILGWVSSTVVPMLASPDASDRTPMLANADVSRISLPSPSSPHTDGPFRRRRTRCSARTGSSSSSLLGRSVIRDDVERVKVLGHVAESVFLWACAYFTEWISLTGTGSLAISQETMQWCRQIPFCRIREDHPLNVTTPRLLLRLALVICQRSDNFDLLQSLLVIFCDMGDVAETLVHEAMSTLVGARQRRVSNSLEMTQRLATCVLSALQEAIRRQPPELQSDSLLLHLPDSLDEFWPQQGSITAALELLIENGMYQRELIQKAANAVQTQELEEQSVSAKPLGCMNLRLIWLIYNMDRSQSTKEIIQSSIPLSQLEQQHGDVQKLANEMLQSMDND